MIYDKHIMHKSGVLWVILMQFRAEIRQLSENCSSFPGFELRVLCAKSQAPKSLS